MLLVVAFGVFAALGGCVVAGGPSSQRSESGPSAPDIRRVDPFQAQRLYNIMTPLLQEMDNPKSPKQVRIGFMDSNEINFEMACKLYV